MKKFLLFAIVLILGVTNVSARHLKKYKMKHDGITREYYMYMPKGIQENAPLVFILHGYGGRPQDVSYYLMEQADKFKFALCLPQGTEDPEGIPCWNIYYDSQAGMETDDISFISALVPTVQDKFHLSKENTFCMGESNGGDMCYFLCHAKPELFTAVASVVGVLNVSVTKKYSYGPLSLPFMQFHGTKDTISFWEGDMDGSEGFGPWLPVPEAVDYMVKAANCKEKVVYEFPHVRGNRVTQYRYLNGDESKKAGVAKEVWFYVVDGGDHHWESDDMNIGDEIVKFFVRYLR